MLLKLAVGKISKISICSPQRRDLLPKNFDERRARDRARLLENPERITPLNGMMLPAVAAAALLPRNSPCGQSVASRNS